VQVEILVSLDLTLKALANSSPRFALKPWGLRFMFVLSQL
jgi:hypothetical protein